MGLKNRISFMDGPYEKFFGQHALSFCGLGVEALLRVREVPGSNPGGNMELGQNFKNPPVKYFTVLRKSC